MDHSTQFGTFSHSFIHIMLIYQCQWTLQWETISFNQFDSELFASHWLCHHKKFGFLNMLLWESTLCKPSP